jgi:CO/xanthine dehydrogenase FAD-binding subunit
MKWMEYKKAKSVSEILTLLEQAGGKGRVVAGGTDLVPQLQQGKYEVKLLIDITQIGELERIADEGDWIRIGAGVTHAEIARSPLIRKEARALAHGCGQVGSPQIRNMGTLIGNVVSAQPAGDGAIPLMALEAELRVVSRQGERWIPIEEAYRGIGLSAVDSTKEVVTEVRFRKLGEVRETGFFRMARRKALALPILNGAVSIIFGPSSTRVSRARIAIGPVAEMPFRPRGAEAYLESKEPSPQLMMEAARIASEEANPRTSLRGSALYRKEMVRINLVRTFETVVDGARKRGSCR